MLLSSHRLLTVLYWIAAAALLYGFLAPRTGQAFFKRIERFLKAVALRPAAPILFAALVPLLIRAIMLPWFPPPHPQIHDEFSYLLQADTFAHGRLSNPTPPFWRHFETEYVLLQPVYASQYQPAQGLILAFGEVLLGHPWFGVWLSIGIMCATLCWALRYIFPPRWALFGALVAALQFGIFGLWMNSYFGGALAACAGALNVACLVRMRRPGKTGSSAALLAFGIIVLFASRPFEALLWLAIAGVWALLSRRKSPRFPIARAFLFFTAVFLLGAALLALYNWKITGSPADPPYLAYQRIYGTPQPFWWQRPFEVWHFNFAMLRDNYLNQLHLYQNRYSLPAMLNAERTRLRDFWRFFIGPFLTPALLFLPFALRDKRIRPWLWISLPFILDKATYHAWFPAQNAPETILILIIVIQCWRHLVVWRRTRLNGLAISRGLVTACCAAIVLGALGRAVEPALPPSLRHLPPLWESLYPARRLRDDVDAKLRRIPGKHLIFVNYAPDHCFCEEWVFNTADFNSQQNLYARTYSPESDEALARYFSDRDVWLVEPDDQPYLLARVSPATLAEIVRAEDSFNASQSLLKSGSSNDLLDLPQHQSSPAIPRIICCARPDTRSAQAAFGPGVLPLGRSNIR